MDQPASPPDRTVPWVVFDGDCAFCTTSAAWVADRLRRRDQAGAALVPWQLTDLEALGSTAARAQREVLWVTPEGEVSGGAAAFAAWLRYRGGPYGVLGTVMTWPGVRRLAAAVYWLVAANRQRLPGGSPACALPPPVAPATSPGPTRPEASKPGGEAL